MWWFVVGFLDILPPSLKTRLYFFRIACGPNVEHYEAFSDAFFRLSNVISLQCSGAVGWATGRASGLYKAGCRFVSGHVLTGDLCLQLSPLSISIILSSNKIQNGYILLVPANPDPPEKWPLKRRERQRCWNLTGNLCFVWYGLLGAVYLT